MTYPCPLVSPPLCVLSYDLCLGSQFIVFFLEHDKGVHLMKIELESLVILRVWINL